MYADIELQITYSTPFRWLVILNLSTNLGLASISTIAKFIVCLFLQSRVMKGCNENKCHMTVTWLKIKMFWVVDYVNIPIWNAYF